MTRRMFNGVTTQTRRRRLGRVLVDALVIMAIASGLVVLAGIWLAPDVTERVAGDVRIKVAETKRKVVDRDPYPTVRLSGPGGMRQVDACDGSFVEMSSYELPGLQQVFAAHNNCKGDVILPWKTGQKVRVAGHGMWVVSDTRDLNKTWSRTDELLGMTGDIILQTCYWGRDVMKFVALTPLEPSSSATPQAPSSSASSR